MENQDSGYMTYFVSVFFNESSAWSNQSRSNFNKKKNEILIYLREIHGFLLQILI